MLTTQTFTSHQPEASTSQNKSSKLKFALVKENGDSKDQPFFQIIDSETSQEIFRVTPRSYKKAEFQRICQIVQEGGLDQLYSQLHEEADSLYRLKHTNSDWLYLTLLDPEENKKLNSLERAQQDEIVRALQNEVENRERKGPTLFSFGSPKFPSRHRTIKEKNGQGVKFKKSKPFFDWGGGIKREPSIIFMPESKEGIKNIIKNLDPGKRVRAVGYHHSSSEYDYFENGDVCISMIDWDVATKLPAQYPQMNPRNDLQGIKIIGEPYIKDGRRVIQCQIGAATCNFHMQDWVHDADGGDLDWGLLINVIMTEITFGGSNAPICHGAGGETKTLSDYVTRVEFINAKGELQVVDDPEQLKAVAGCFGLLGIVTSITLELDEMTYANFATVGKKLIAHTIPPAEKVSEQTFKELSEENQKALNNPEDLQRAYDEFVKNCKRKYAEFFWFPLHKEGWVNCWDDDGKKEHAVRYPGTLTTERQRAESYLSRVANNVIFSQSEKLAKIQTKLLGSLAMALLPHEEQVVCTREDATHFRQGIQNAPKTRMEEFEIPIPLDKDGEPDWSICQRAWWAAIEAVYSKKYEDSLPMRTTLEMRITGSSDILMAPQHNNKHTCSIEILTPDTVDKDLWHEFVQDVLDKWAALQDYQGQYLNIRPHWAKHFEGYQIKRDSSWKNQWTAEQHKDLGQYINEDTHTISVPIERYLKEIAYKDQIQEFGKQLQAVCKAGGYSLQDIQQKFSNPFFDEFLFPSILHLEEHHKKGKGKEKMDSISEKESESTSESESEHEVISQVKPDKKSRKIPFLSTIKHGASTIKHSAYHLLHKKKKDEKEPYEEQPVFKLTKK